MKKIILIILTIIILITIILVIIPKKDKPNTDETQETKEEIKEMETNKLYIKIDNNILEATFEQNSSAVALLNKLKEQDVVIDMHDFGNFEKVGSLGFSLPTNDTNITTKPGDVILYQGNQLTIYYDTNTWTFTKVATIDKEYLSNLKEVLGTNPKVTLSINK